MDELFNKGRVLIGDSVSIETIDFERTGCLVYESLKNNDW